MSAPTPDHPQQSVPRQYHLWRAAPLGTTTGSQIQPQDCSCGPQLPQKAVAAVVAPKEVPLLCNQLWGGMVLEEQVELLGCSKDACSQERGCWQVCSLHYRQCKPVGGESVASNTRLAQGDTHMLWAPLKASLKPNYTHWQSCRRMHPCRGCIDHLSWQNGTHCSFCRGGAFAQGLNSKHLEG